MAKYPFQSPYVAFNNNPIYWTDPYGDDPPCDNCDETEPVYPLPSDFDVDNLVGKKFVVNPSAPNNTLVKEEIKTGTGSDPEGFEEITITDPDKISISHKTTNVAAENVAGSHYEIRYDGIIIGMISAGSSLDEDGRNQADKPEFKTLRIVAGKLAEYKEQVKNQTGTLQMETAKKIITLQKYYNTHTTITPVNEQGKILMDNMGLPYSKSIDELLSNWGVD